MNITKDEARILAFALEDGKYEILIKLERQGRLSSKVDQIRVHEELTKLQDRLEEFGDDKRRHGRKSRNGISDVIKRYCGIK